LNHLYIITREDKFLPMVPTINEKTELRPKEFFDELAEDYDGMTGFEYRFPYERPFFRMLVERYHLKNALDAGCGTGFHSVLLAQLGLQVTAVDISENMLVQVRSHAKEYNVPLHTINSTFPRLAHVVNKKFDSIFCLGNTFAHVLSEKELRASLKSFYKILHPDGLLFLQILNYNRILNQKVRIQNIRETQGKIFVRMYDYEGKLLRFNILTIEKRNEGILHSFKSVEHRPWKAPAVIRLVQQAGFDTIKIFGSIAMESYDAQSSKDLVVLAQRMTSRD
jgi:glycine/sarcosine N-methyltransferase